jgi:CubicO group peptidase (beta-lactamase class C family)
METLQSMLDRQYADRRFPGAVALARDDQVEVGRSGVRTIGGAAMTRDTLFRIASVTKPILAAVTMVLVERGRLRLDDAVDRWLPELGEPVVMRQLTGDIDDVVPAERAITVRDLLTFQSGHGFPPDFDLPVVQLLMSDLSQGPVQPQSVAAPDEWMARLARRRSPRPAIGHQTCSRAGAAPDRSWLVRLCPGGAHVPCAWFRI